MSAEREKGQLGMAQALSGDSLVEERLSILREFYRYKPSIMNNLDSLAESGGFEPPIELLTL